MIIVTTTVITSVGAVKQYPHCSRRQALSCLIFPLLLRQSAHLRVRDVGCIKGFMTIGTTVGLKRSGGGRKRGRGWGGRGVVHQQTATAAQSCRSGRLFSARLRNTSQKHDVQCMKCEVLQQLVTPLPSPASHSGTSIGWRARKGPKFLGRMRHAEEWDGRVEREVQVARQRGAQQSVEERGRWDGACAGCYNSSRKIMILLLADLPIKCRRPSSKSGT